MRTDWMPGRREEQIAMARTWKTVLTARGNEWAVTAAEISELDDLRDDAERMWAKSQTNRGDRTLNAKAREAFEALVMYMRRLRRKRFFSPPMIDSDWISLGMRPPDTVRTDHVAVPETVEFELRLRKIREVVVAFRVTGSESRAKPEGYDGAVLIWDVLDAPPDSPDHLTRHTMASRTPHIIEFDETERGKTAYIAAAWQNERGIIGAWSGIQSAVVP